MIEGVRSLSVDSTPDPFATGAAPDWQALIENNNSGGLLVTQDEAEAAIDQALDLGQITQEQADQAKASLDAFFSAPGRAGGATDSNVAGHISKVLAGGKSIPASST